MNRRIPDFVVERVHLGEATTADKARVMADPDARTRLEELAHADVRFHKEHPAREHVGTITRKLHVARTKDAVERRKRGWMITGAVLVPLAALVVGTVLIDGGTAPVPGDPAPVYEGVKGTPQLHVFRNVRGRARTLREGVVLRERDILRLGVTPRGAKHGMLLSIDGRGEVTVHAPDDDDTRLPSRHTLLPHAYELDDAPRFERFFLVTGDAAFDVGAVVEAARDLAATPESGREAPLALPEGLEQQDFIILKDVL